MRLGTTRLLSIFEARRRLGMNEALFRLTTHGIAPGRRGLRDRCSTDRSMVQYAPGRIKRVCQHRYRITFPDLLTRPVLSKPMWSDEEYLSPVRRKAECGDPRNRERISHAESYRTAGSTLKNFSHTSCPRRRGREICTDFKTWNSGLVVGNIPLPHLIFIHGLGSFLGSPLD